MKALISVYDKTGIVELAKTLHGHGVELISTGGTHQAIQHEANVPVSQVSDLTGFPEILNGRVKTLHPLIYGGILALRNVPQHLEQLENHGINVIDLVVVNLYPFLDVIQNPLVSQQEALENIDIGGPTLLRAAAKNFPYVLVVVDPNDYSWVSESLVKGNITKAERQYLAYKAFHHVSRYDTAIAQYLSDRDEPMPPTLNITVEKVMDLRYGENPHQKGALYASPTDRGGVPQAQQLHGREISFNNLMDAHSAWQVVQEFTDPTVVVVKHTNPCGLSCHSNQTEAYSRAYSGDPVSAFGGILGFNSIVTMDTAKEINKIFYEVIVAPHYELEALELLKQKRNLRILKMPGPENLESLMDVRSVNGGILVQTQDSIAEDKHSWNIVTNRAPTGDELSDLSFAWIAAKHIKSNAITLAKDRTLLGMGAGQPNRVNSVYLALKAAEHNAQGSVLASDAFFPFADSVDMAASGGITAIIQPGGSVKDNEVIEVANQHNIAMVFTGIRHFKH